jgi:hypothetical protein
MLASITPLGERGRGASWPRTATAYVVASVAGGAAIGAALGGLGSLLLGDQPRWLVIAIAAVAFAGAALDVAGRLPTMHRQVDESWLATYRDWVYGAGFGFQLGLAAVTIVTSASTYLLWCLEVLTASPAAGAAVGAVFGLARALPLLTMYDVVDPQALRASHRTLQQRLPLMRGLTVAVQVAAGVALMVAAA